MGGYAPWIEQADSAETGIPTYLAEDPLSCVALGTGKALESLGSLEDSFNNVKKK